MTKICPHDKTPLFGRQEQARFGHQRLLKTRKTWRCFKCGYWEAGRWEPIPSLRARETSGKAQVS